MAVENISESQIRQIFENAPVGILTLNSDLVVESVNQSSLQFGLFEFSEKSNLLGKKILDLNTFQSDEIKSYLELFQEGIPFETKISTKETYSSTEIVIVVKGTPILVENKFEGGIIIIEDFRTSTETSSDNLLRSDLFNNLISSISDYVLITDIYGNIKYTFPKEVFGANYSRIETDGKMLFDLFTDLNSHLIEQTLIDVVKDKKTRTIELPQKEYKFGGDFNLTLIPIAEKSVKVKYFFILFKNNSEEREKLSNLNSEIQELKAYRTITSAIVDAVIRINLQGKITFWNDSAVKLFGFTRSEVFGKFIGSVLPEIDHIYFNHLLENLKSSKTFETQFVKLRP